MYVNHERKLIFLANPRTASTAIANALVKQRGFVLEGTHHSTVPKHELTFSLWSGYTTFAVVRNHFDTVVSWVYGRPRVPYEQLKFNIENITWSLTNPMVMPHEFWWLHRPNVELRFEDLPHCLTKLIGPITLELENVTVPRERLYGADYHAFYDMYTKAYVEGRFWEEMRKYEYEW